MTKKLIITSTQPMIGKEPNPLGEKPIKDHLYNLTDGVRKAFDKRLEQWQQAEQSLKQYQFITQQEQEDELAKTIFKQYHPNEPFYKEDFLAMRAYASLKSTLLQQPLPLSDSEIRAEAEKFASIHYDKVNNPYNWNRTKNGFIAGYKLKSSPHQQAGYSLEDMRKCFEAGRNYQRDVDHNEDNYPDYNNYIASLSPSYQVGECYEIEESLLKQI